MTNYRRFYVPGGTWFFTVSLAPPRKGKRLLVEKIDRLRKVFREVKDNHPFDIVAICILPQHLHCIWTLPDNDGDYSKRWNQLKGNFSRGINVQAKTRPSHQKRRERGIWQRRFHAHYITDERDFETHFHYTHWNPVKHGWVDRVIDWPYSSFHKYVRQGVYTPDWGHSGDFDIEAGEPDDE